MKTFIVSFLLMAAALLPILFFPLLALTLLALVIALFHFSIQIFQHPHHTRNLTRP